MSGNLLTSGHKKALVEVEKDSRSPALKGVKKEQGRRTGNECLPSLGGPRGSLVL